MRFRRKGEEIKGRKRTSLKLNAEEFSKFKQLAELNNSSASEVVDYFIKLYNSKIINHSQIVLKVNKDQQ